MGQSCSGMSGPCPGCQGSCGDNCHRDEPCVDRCCNLCCQFCLDGCCLICPDDCGYTLCFTCTMIANSCAAVLTTEQPRSTQKPREDSHLEEGQVI
ncbi:small cysteine and glycine repeat-containing protein 1-like [Puntigrus tetrazona]|uniref:small cysteine and glycine repeat-containing protein 1-like n=1 Tax=Puntigrus tetrazona TaxID=1606681 RepID=UPI001C89DCE7|nr:small cysteine and glycine repeat-containing protein 1-like [Puntigrus tetrazona]